MKWNARFSNRTPSVALSSLAFALALGSSPARAADAAPQSGTAEAAKSSSTETQEIIVTANKRNENISKVGVSITALSGDALAQRNIASPDELARIVPSLALAPSTHGTPVYTLRGVGYNADALAVYPAVSVSLDQAPLTFPVLAGHSMYDLERVEVLKGPQGTLFGQNSTGGAINYVASKPTETLQAGASLDYGRFNEIHGSGFVSGPITDTLGLRVAVDGEHRDPWQYNFTNPSQKNGETSYFAGRVIADWRASDKLKFELDLNGSVDRSQPQALQLVASLPSNPAAPTAQELSAVLSPNNARAANWPTSVAQVNGDTPYAPATPAGNRRLFQASLRADLALSDTIGLTSITTYNHLGQNMSFSLDGTQYELAQSPIDDGSINDFSQELRLSNASAPAQTFRWTVGGNYNYSKISEVQYVTFSENSLSNAGTNFIHVVDVDSHDKVNTFAIFGNGEYDVASNITLKGGVRYTKTVNNDSLCDSDPAADQHLDQLFTLLSTLLGGQTIPLSSGQCYPLNNSYLPINSQGVAGGPLDQRLAENNVSWRGGVDFRASRGLLLYANVSRGYKAGSFPTITASLQNQLAPARQESVTAYEGGFKAKLLDNRMQWSGAVFYNDYRDKQVQGTVATGLFGLLQDLSNIPKSHIFGVETDLTVRPVSGLTLTGSASYLDTRVDDYTATNVFGAQTSFVGNRLPFAPEWTFVGDVNYRVQTSSGGTAFVGVSTNYRTAVDAYVGGSELAVPDNGVNRTSEQYPFLIKGYALVDGRIGYEFPGNTATISIWGKNIFNKFYAQNVISYNDIITRVAGQPSAYGVTLKILWR